MKHVIKTYITQNFAYLLFHDFKTLKASICQLYRELTLHVKIMPEAGITLQERAKDAL